MIENVWKCKCFVSFLKYWPETDTCLLSTVVPRPVGKPRQPFTFDHYNNKRYTQKQRAFGVYHQLLDRFIFNTHLIWNSITGTITLNKLFISNPVDLMCNADTYWELKRMPSLHYFRCCIIGYAWRRGWVDDAESNVNMRHPAGFSGDIVFANVWITPQTRDALGGLRRLIAALRLSDRLAKWGAPDSTCLLQHNDTVLSAGSGSAAPENEERAGLHIEPRTGLMWAFHQGHYSAEGRGRSRSEDSTSGPITPGHSVGSSGKTMCC